jgi:uncharacterized membrane protein
MLRRVSLLGLWLEPLGSLLWVFFLVWTALIGLLWTTGWGETQLDAWVPNLGLRRALIFLCKVADAVWIGLAAAVAYLCVADTHGLGTARRWALIVFAGAAAIVAASVWTTWPLGPARYTMQLGSKVGPVPAGAPLLWLTVVLGGRALWMRLFRRASHGQIALGAGVCALLTDLNLEPHASQLRAWWFWYSPETHAAITAPLQNYATWLLGAALLAYLVREPRVVGDAPAHSDKLIVVLVLLNVVCLAGHLAAWLR